MFIQRPSHARLFGTETKNLIEQKYLKAKMIRTPFFFLFPEDPWNNFRSLFFLIAAIHLKNT